MTNWLSPAKINLYLAVLGMREDGFHDLDSLVVRLNFGDRLALGISPDGIDHYQCSDSSLSFDESNLVYRAVRLYREKTGYSQALSIQHKKCVPFGAGLGGGSSNATTTLQALNSFNPNPVSQNHLVEWSAEIGSDCPLFFYDGVTRVRGRGERVESFQIPGLIPGSEPEIVIVHPGFEVSAAWAYRRFREDDSPHYTSSTQAEQEVCRWARESNPWNRLYRNDLSRAVDQKYLAIPAIRRSFEERFGLRFMMSGSGSACYFFPESQTAVESCTDFIRRCWGSGCFVKRCRLLL